MSERLDQPTGADEDGDPQARTRARDVARDEGVSNLQALQRVLYRSAKQDPTRRFHALYDKLTRSDVMWQAWVNVATNHGAPGIDGVSIDSVEAGGTEGVRSFLDSLAAEVKAQSYRPQPLRRVNIPKAGKPGETRPLGIPTLRDRVLMSAAKLVLEPIFEADFSPASFGFRPKRSAHDALEVIRQSANGGAHWVLDADIKSCFDEIDQDALMALIERRVCDRAMLKLLRSWLRAGIIEGGVLLRRLVGNPTGFSDLTVALQHRLERPRRGTDQGETPDRKAHQVCRRLGRPLSDKGTSRDGPIHCRDGAGHARAAPASRQDQDRQPHRWGRGLRLSGLPQSHVRVREMAGPVLPPEMAVGAGHGLHQGQGQRDDPTAIHRVIARRSG